MDRISVKNLKNLIITADANVTISAEDTNEVSAYLVSSFGRANKIRVLFEVTDNTLEVKILGKTNHILLRNLTLIVKIPRNLEELWIKASKNISLCPDVSAKFLFLDTENGTITSYASFLEGTFNMQDSSEKSDINVTSSSDVSLDITSNNACIFVNLIGFSKVITDGTSKDFSVIEYIHKVEKGPTASFKYTLGEKASLSIY